MIFIRRKKDYININVGNEKIGLIDDTAEKIKTNTLYEIIEVVSKPCLEIEKAGVARMKGSFLYNLDIDKMPYIENKKMDAFTVFEHRIPKYIYIETAEEGLEFLYVVGVKFKEVF